jgi:hypothetical protein
MSRRVPEAAVLVGVVLSVSFALYGVLFGDPLSTALVSVLVLYPFVGYGVRVDDDPAATLLPDPTLAAVAVAGGLAFAYGLATLRPFLGLLVGLVLVVPAALFHATHADSVNPLDPAVTLGLAAAAGVCVLVAGVVVGRVTGDLGGTASTAAFAAGLLVLGAAEYHARRGRRLPRRVEGAAVLTTLAGAALAMSYFTFVAGAALAGLAVAATLLVVGAYFALVDERRERTRRRRRHRRGGGGWF